MSGGDAVRAVVWLGLLAAAVAGAVAARRRGGDPHLLRDALHVGAGVWVLGWPWWDGSAAPMAITAAVALVALGLPTVVRAYPRLGALARAVSADDERWAGIVLYVTSYAAFTAAAFAGPATWAVPSAAALLALSWGDGLGGLVGRRYGRRGFRTPGAKRKTLAGAATVAVAGAAAILVVTARMGGAVGVLGIAGGGVVAMVAEALAPRSTDNVVLPAAVFGWLWWVTWAATP